MSLQTKRRASVTRKVLCEIINNQQTPPDPSTRRYNQSSLEVLKLNEALSFLERKVEKQYSEIKVISDQLSKETILREQCAVLLVQEKEKNAVLSQHLIKANKNIAELKKRASKTETIEKGESTARQDHEIKMSKYRDMIRKKDEILTRQQHRIEELLNCERVNNQLQQQLSACKESFSKSKKKEYSQLEQIQKMKNKILDLQELVKQKETSVVKNAQIAMFAEEKLKRMRVQMDELSQESSDEIATLKGTINDLRKINEQQQFQISELAEMKSHRTIPEWSLAVYSNEIKRFLGSTLKDGNLRRKVQKGVEEVLVDIQGSFNTIIRHLTQQ